MTAETLSLAALGCFALGAVAAIAGFWVEGLRRNAFQFVPAFAGLVLKTASIGVSCMLSETHFFNSASDICGLLAWALSFSFLAALTVCAVRSLGALALPLVSILLGLSHFFDRQGVDPGFPAGRLLAVHILSAFLGYGLFLTACGASVLYLEQARQLKRKFFGVLFRDLPSLERLERLELVCAWLGFGIFIVALATGAVMAHRINRPFWFEPKATAAAMTWLIFGVLVVGRTARWLRGRAAAKFVLAGAAAVLLTFAFRHPKSTQPGTGAQAAPARPAACEPVRKAGEGVHA